MSAERNIFLALAGALFAGPASADPSAVAADAARAFGNHCFNPYLTAETAHADIARPGVRVDFYDTAPFASDAPSPATGRAPTPGTDRRCEVAFDGTHVETARNGAITGLAREGIRAQTAVPAAFAAQPGTEFIAARLLNPRRIAVVQVGTRPGADGAETFINVERLNPLTEASQ